MPECASESTQVIVISKSGDLVESNIQTGAITGLSELTEILSKKCGNKKSTGFSCYHTWRYRNKNYKSNGSSKYTFIDLWAKTDGRAGQENKYELPPPIDEIIFFGNMILVARIDKETACDLSLKQWEIIYEHLFGGFEDLAATAKEDDNEIDELDYIPASKKTHNGYLKDGFIVEDDDVSSGSPKTHARLRSKNKNKKHSSSESEFITETDTETTSNDDDHIDDATTDLVESISIPNVVIKSKSATKPKMSANKKVNSKKNVVDNTNNSDSELSEELYDN